MHLYLILSSIQRFSWLGFKALFPLRLSLASSMFPFLDLPLIFLPETVLRDFKALSIAWGLYLGTLDYDLFKK